MQKGAHIASPSTQTINKELIFMDLTENLIYVFALIFLLGIWGSWKLAKYLTVIYIFPYLNRLLKKEIPINYVTIISLLLMVGLCYVFFYIFALVATLLDKFIP